MKTFLILNFLALSLVNANIELSTHFLEYESSQESEFPTTSETITPRSQKIIDDDVYKQPQNKEDLFDWIMTKEVIKQNAKENVIVSPISVKLLMTILVEAAGQDINSPTRQELKVVLPDKKTLHCSRKYFEKILSVLQEKNSDYTLNIGSKGFLRNDINPSQKFQSNVEHFYKFLVNNVDFSDSVNLVSKINDWVSEITMGKITALVDTEAISNSAVLLINAIYFRGLWKVPFEKTTVADFYIEDGVSERKEFVEQVGDFYYFYSKNLGAKILRLPYEGGSFSMFILLPFREDGLEELVEKLDAEMLKHEVDKMELIEALVTIPKFRFDSSLKLNSVMKAIGINEIFTENATFPFLSAGKLGLKVSNIIQKSGIVVDEKGSEAFAATEIELIDKFGGNPRQFNANHPFVFYIEDDRTGAKLFSGVVNNPEY